MAEPSLEPVLDLLRSDQDERKLAGLLLCTKVLRTDREPDPSTLEDISDAIGVVFLRRLIRTQENAALYRAIAIDVMSVLALNENVAQRYARERLCEEIASVIGGEMTKEVFTIYTSCLNAGDTFPLSSLTDLWRSADHDTFFKPAINTWIQPALFRSVLFPIDMTSSIIMALATDLDDRPDLERLEALEVLDSILSRLRAGWESERELDSELVMKADPWATQIRHGLRHILSTRAGDVAKYHALSVSQLMLDLFGYPWGSADPEFPALLLTNVAVESRVLLEFIVEHDSESAVDTLRVCFSLFEMAVAFLVEDDAAFEPWKRDPALHWAELRSDSIIVIQDRLTDVIRAVFAFLSDRESHQIYDHVLLSIAMRILGIFFAEDSVSFRSEMEAISPYLARVCELSLECSDPFAYIIPCWMRLADDADGAELLLQCRAEQSALRLLATFAEDGDETLQLVTPDTCSFLLLLFSQAPMLAMDEDVVQSVPIFCNLFLRLVDNADDSEVCLQLLAIIASVLSHSDVKVDTTFRPIAAEFISSFVPGSEFSEAFEMVKKKFGSFVSLQLAESTTTAHPGNLHEVTLEQQSVLTERSS